MKKTLAMSNKRVYESRNIVEEYSSLDQLKKPEQTILNDIKAELEHMKMLDIGVGGGRTTVHFANLVNQYIGIDYSENMIDVCKKRFSSIISENISFKVCDARDMKIFENNYFDFILFSFNGIDSVSYEDRLKILKEIIRLGKKGGYFCFSTHNIQHDELFNIRVSLNPIRLSWRIFRYTLLRFLNKNLTKLREQNYAIIKDNAHMFRLKHCYIKPIEQIKQLNNLGFKNIKIYSYNGNRIEDLSKLEILEDLYLYYLCNI